MGPDWGPAERIFLTLSRGPAGDRNAVAVTRRIQSLASTRVHEGPLRFIEINPRLNTEVKLSSVFQRKGR